MKTKYYGLFVKINNRLKHLLIKYTYGKSFYPMLYRSWWHMYLSDTKDSKNTNYLTARPNQGAGIGHQIANWIAGCWFAKEFGLEYATIPFSTKDWNDFLGFNENSIEYDSLIKDRYCVVKLPLFDEFNVNSIKMIKEIIKSYAHKNVVFILEQDQFYFDQFGCQNQIKDKFYNAKARINQTLVYDEKNFNLAIHVRRGDITIGQINKNPNLLLRWQENDYFINVLNNVLKSLTIQSPIHIYLFSQGKKEDFKEFDKFANMTLCLDMNVFDSFSHMVYADLLITSKSSFSYKPALLSNGIKICPDNFWHGYPKDKKWIIANEKGNFDTTLLENASV